jgi:hypothetical protein
MPIAIELEVSGILGHSCSWRLELVVWEAPMKSWKGKGAAPQAFWREEIVVIAIFLLCTFPFLSFFK